MGSSRVVPIRIVTPSGELRRLGQLRLSTHVRSLELEALGYPLLDVGEHAVEEDVPWAMQDAAPSGFIGARFAQWFSELGLPARPRDWTAEHTLAALENAGHDLTGNLVVGDGSYERYQRIFGEGRTSGPAREEAESQFAALIDEARAQTNAMSSMGGERPKFTLRLSDGTGWLVKFSPPVSTDLGQRWADLLRLESHCAATLAAASIPAARARITLVDDRVCLVAERFDRVEGRGRIGAASWYWLAAAQYRIVNAAQAGTVAIELRCSGWLSSDELRRFEVVHEFSRAIGNNDTHLGNYGLLFDERGQPSLAPFYDVLPMKFAPSGDELPDRWIEPSIAGTKEHDVRRLVTALCARVREDAAISEAFRGRWLGYVRESDDRSG